MSGKNLTENEYVKLGAHHTVQLEPHRAFQLSKAVWDGLDLARIREACDPSVSADLAVVLITASTPQDWIQSPQSHAKDLGCLVRFERLCWRHEHLSA